MKYPLMTFFSLSIQIIRHFLTTFFSGTLTESYVLTRFNSFQHLSSTEVEGMLKFFHEAPRDCGSSSFTAFCLASHVLPFLSHLIVSIFLQTVLFISFHASIRNGSNNTTKFLRLVSFPAQYKTLFQIFEHFSFFDDHLHGLYRFLATVRQNSDQA